MKWRLAAMLGCGLLVVSLFARADERRHELCARLPKGHTCTIVVEEPWSTPPKDSVHTEDGKLTLKFENGEKRTWTNNIVDGEPMDTYTLEGFLAKSRHFLIWHSEYEEANGELVSYANGDSVVIYDHPEVYPDGKRFFTIVDPYGGDGSSSLNIYSLAKARVSQVAAFDISQWKVLAKGIWVTSSEIAIFGLPVDSSEETGSAEFLGTARLVNGKWKLVRVGHR